MRKKRLPPFKQTIITFLSCLLILFTSAVVYGDSLQDEFDGICIHTQEAESLSLEKLQELVTACDQLQKKIEAIDDEKNKVLLFRLQKCCNFFAYMIELKSSDN